MSDLLEALRQALILHHELDVRADLFTSAEYQRLLTAIQETET